MSWEVSILRVAVQEVVDTLNHTGSGLRHATKVHLKYALGKFIIIDKLLEGVEFPTRIMNTFPLPNK